MKAKKNKSYGIKPTKKQQIVFSALNGKVSLKLIDLLIIGVIIVFFYQAYLYFNSGNY